MDIRFTDANALLVIEYVLAFYFILFAVGNLIREGVKYGYIHNRVLYVSKIVEALWHGIKIPLIVTVIGAIVTTLGWIFQEPPQYGDYEDWYRMPWTHGFASIIVHVQLLIIISLGMVMVGAVAYGAYKAIGLVGKYVLLPVGRMLAKAWRWVRPLIPIKW